MRAKPVIMVTPILDSTLVGSLKRERPYMQINTTHTSRRARARRQSGYHAHRCNTALPAKRQMHRRC